MDYYENESLSSSSDSDDDSHSSSSESEEEMAKGKESQITYEIDSDENGLFDQNSEDDDLIDMNGKIVGNEGWRKYEKRRVAYKQVKLVPKEKMLAERRKCLMWGCNNLYDAKVCQRYCTI